NNLRPMLAAGLRNLPLTKYLVDQVMQSPEDRLESLQDFVPEARMSDWDLEVAGQRVQVIKKHPEKGGVLEFGTEVVSSADGTIAALLGASPGASTAVSIMIDLLKRCFPEQMASKAWQERLQQMILSYGKSLADDEDLARFSRDHTAKVLGLDGGPSAAKG
ncbi:MAG: malate:quinone oxidoreductase, partial [Cytophagaceae bacterium]